MPEVGEALQCPYCLRTFSFGQEISKPTRVELPKGLSGGSRSGAAADSAASQSTQVGRNRSVKQSNFIRTGDSWTNGETKSGWLNHLAFVFGIGGTIVVSLVVAVVAWLICGGYGRIDASRSSIAGETLPKQVDAGVHVANAQSVVTDGVALDGESAKKDVVKVEQLKAVPMLPNNESADKGGDSSTPEEKGERDDFASDGADDDKDPFGPNSADDNEDSFHLFAEKKSEGEGESVAAWTSNDAPRQVKKGAEEKQSVIASSKEKTFVGREEIKIEYATLKKERAVLAGAISQLDMIPDPVRAVYTLSQLLENYSLSKVYDKWAGKKWGEFSEKMLRKIEEADRRYQLSTRSRGARGANSKAKIVDAERTKEGLDPMLPKDARKEAFAEIIASIKIRIEEDALKPLKAKLEVQEKAYAEVVEEEKREAAEKKRREEVAREAARKKMEPIYKKRKDWYKEQLNYNGLSETYFDMYMVGYGAGACLSLSDDATGSTLQVNIVPVDDKGTVNIEWPRSMPKGFAQELIESRIMVYKYENPTWEKDLKERSRRQAEEAKRRAEEEKKKNSYKGYTPKKRRIDPSLKRFKGPGERSLNRFGPGGR